MKLKLLTILALTCIAQVTFAQSSAVKDSAKAQLTANLHAIFSGDFETVSTHIAPELLEMMGGKDSAVAALKQALGSALANGLAMDSLSLGEPSTVLSVNKELQMTIPVYLRMKMNGMKVHISPTMVAVSPDQGKSWYFFDNSKLDPDTIRKIHPALSKDLVIPESPQAQVEK